MTLDEEFPIQPRTRRPRRSTVEEIETEHQMAEVIERAVETTPSMEDLAQLKKTCWSRIRLLFKKFVLLLLKTALKD
jgi:hypothetical protein